MYKENPYADESLEAKESGIATKKKKLKKR